MPVEKLPPSPHKGTLAQRLLGTEMPYLQMGDHQGPRTSSAGVPERSLNLSRSDGMLLVALLNSSDDRAAGGFRRLVESLDREAVNELCCRMLYILIFRFFITSSWVRTLCFHSFIFCA